MAARAILLSVAFVAMAPRGAEAQVAGSAQPHLDAALKAYEAKDYDAAIREFEQAYAIDPKPALLYATAQAYRFANRCTKALELYRRYLTTKLTDAQISATKNGIALCEGAVKQPEPEPPAKPEPKLEPPARAEPARTPEPPTTVAAEQRELPPAPHDTPWYKDTLGDALTVGGVVGIGVGVGFLVMASSSEHDAKTAQFRADFLRSLDEATQRRRIGAVSLGAGAALAVGGVLVYVLRDHHAHRLVGGIDGHTLYVSGTF